MSPRDPRLVGVALISGLLFGAGLTVSGMTRPDKVIGFLDVLGGWDPTLVFVLAGATGTHLLLRPIASRLAPERVAAGTPSPRTIDRRLLLGSGLFGVGWGLSGYCPGPVVTATLPGASMTAVFLLSMLAGMGLWSQVSRRGRDGDRGRDGGRAPDGRPDRSRPPAPPRAVPLTEGR